MRVIGKKILAEFCEKHSDCRSWISNWLLDINNANWLSPHEIKQRYQSASFLGEKIVIFNVKGNLYRLEVTVAYATQVIAIVWIGTHSEYTKRYK